MEILIISKFLFSLQRLPNKWDRIMFFDTFYERSRARKGFKNSTFVFLTRATPANIIKLFDGTSCCPNIAEGIWRTSLTLGAAIDTLWWRAIWRQRSVGDELSGCWRRMVALLETPACHPHPTQQTYILTSLTNHRWLHTALGWWWYSHQHGSSASQNVLVHLLSTT